MAVTRTDPPFAADEVTSLLAFLDYHRATLLQKVEGLSDEQLRIVHPPSTMSLGGLLKHLAFVEGWWFGEVLMGEPASPPFDTVDWDADRDWEWHSAADDTGADLLALHGRVVERSRALTAELLAEGGLDRLSVKDIRAEGDARRPVSLRWVLLHLVEEYARHNGHADLIRESIDGATGE